MIQWRLQEPLKNLDRHDEREGRDLEKGGGGCCPPNLEENPLEEMMMSLKLLQSGERSETAEERQSSRDWD